MTIRKFKNKQQDILAVELLKCGAESLNVYLHSLLHNGWIKEIVFEYCINMHNLLKKINKLELPITRA